LSPAVVFATSPGSGSGALKGKPQQAQNTAPQFLQVKTERKLIRKRVLPYKLGYLPTTGISTLLAFVKMLMTT